jgi:hypothetical protein
MRESGGGSDVQDGGKSGDHVQAGLGVEGMGSYIRPCREEGGAAGATGGSRKSPLPILFQQDTLNGKHWESALLMLL